MTIEWARFILKTYTLPMTAEQMLEYKKALRIVSGFYLKGI